LINPELTASVKERKDDFAAKLPNVAETSQEVSSWLTNDDQKNVSTTYDDPSLCPIFRIASYLQQSMIVAILTLFETATSKPWLNG